MNPPKKLLEILEKEDNFLILTHSTPDGDAFGSSIALKLFLKQLGKKAEVFTEFPIPFQYQFLPHIDLIKNLEHLSLENFNVLILVDCNNLSRVSYEKEIIDKIKKFKREIVIIDHHIEDSSSNEFESIKWIEPEQAATGMLIYFIIKALGKDITEEIATNLYTAIIVDTGNFQFDNTSANVLNVAGELAKAGAKPSYIYQRSFECWTDNRFNLFVKMLNTVEKISSLAIACITKEMFEQTNTSEPDTERFVEFLRILDSIKISALFRQIDKDYYKASLRSKGDIDVSKIAKKFGGGGHKNAAGYRIKASYEEAKKRLIDELNENCML